MSLSKPKLKRGDTIVIASHNKGKIKEFRSLLSKYNFNLLTSSDLEIGDIDETGNTFEENSIIKANSIPEGYISISDDSGLCVKHLNDNPGIFSARFSKECGGWLKAMKALYEELISKNKTDFSAKFVCSVTIKFSSSIFFSYIGEVKGVLVWPPTGTNGFGYDPFFIPQGYKQTFAEMEHAKKILIDHRYAALTKLIKSHLVDN